MTYKLFLDDERYPVTSDWIIARTVEDAMWYIENRGIPFYISFDHDLGKNRLNGMDFAKLFAHYAMDHNVILAGNFDFYVHSQNPVGAENIRSYMTQWLENYR